MTNEQMQANALKMKEILFAQGWRTAEGLEDGTQVAMIINYPYPDILSDLFINWTQYNSLTPVFEPSTQSIPVTQLFYTNPIKYNVKIAVQDGEVIGYIPKGNRTRGYKAYNGSLIKLK